MVLANLHQDLRRRMEDAERRRTPWLLVEHGLSEREVDDIVLAVKTGLEQYDISSDFWEERYLPLLLVATEVGYDFGGERHAFWPELNARLGFNFGEMNRRERLIQFFRRMSASVPETEWTRFFRLLAYPITHAVLPKWLHGRVLTLLEGTHVGGTLGLSDLYGRVKDDLQLRPLSLLFHPSRESVAKTVLDSLLELGEPDGLSSTALERFRRDIDGDRVLRSRRRQLGARIRGVTQQRPAAKATTNQRTGAPVLTFELDLERLELSLPPLRPIFSGPPAIEQRPIRILDEQRAVGLAQLLRRGAPITNLPPYSGEPRSLVSDDLAKAVPSDEARAALRAGRVQLRRPMLFRARGEGIAVQVLDGVLDAGRPAWALAESWLALSGSEPIGSVAGLYCFQLNTADPEVQTWVSSLGGEIRRRPAVNVVGVPSLHRPFGSAFAPGDTVALELTEGPVFVNGVARQSGLYVVALEPSVKLDVGAERKGPTTTINLRQEQVSSAEEVTLDLVGAELSSDAFWERRIGLRVGGRRGLLGLRATLRVELGRRVIARVTTAQLPPLPAVLLPDDGIWKRLAQESGRQSHREKTITLVAEVANLGRAQWSLEPRPTAASWDDEVADADEEIIGYTLFDLRSPVELINRPPAGPYLKVPQFRDGEPRIGAGLCVAPKGVKLQDLEPARPRRLRREWAALEALLHGLLAWQSAQSGTWPAEFARRSAVAAIEAWIVCTLCGERWDLAERSALCRIPPFGEMLARQVLTAEPIAAIVADRPEAEALLRRALAAVFYGGESWLPAMLADRSPEDRVVTRVRDAFARAALNSTPLDGSAAASLLNAVQQAMLDWDEALRIAPLLRWVLPQSARRGLERIAEMEHPRDALIDDLADWLRAYSQVSRWPREQVEALLSIWLWPTTASVDEGRFERALADQQGCRAVRYVALRRRQVGG